ncbi:MAG: GIY-YIG nuclease family protein [Ignavibacteriae bacterium]|nr:GIY-YIG nuclease family protein [Ignavibacteriota bacterium]
MYIVYILKSKSTGKYYIGQTQNLEERLHRHNSGQSKYTKGKGPWNIVYTKGCASRIESLKLEKKLKSYKNKNYIEKIIMAEATRLQSGHSCKRLSRVRISPSPQIILFIYLIISHYF